jgi:tetratricopeptide (TPR) repeat protein
MAAKKLGHRIAIRGFAMLYRAVLSFALIATTFSQAPQPAPTNAYEGMGKTLMRVSTQNAEAQKMFAQGLALVYGFNHDEAVRSFQAALKADPNLAMAWWGIALANGSNYNLPSMADREKAAFDAIKKAQALAPKATQREKDYIAALSVRYAGQENADYAALGQKYAAAMRDLKNKYPEDLDAATLFAESMMNLRPWKLWTYDGKMEPGTEEIVSTLESVLRRDPNHVGANHYYIHAIEAGPDAAHALPSAERLGTLAPAAGHLVHMPSHIYYRTGDFEDAAKVNVAAANADRAYIERSKAQGIYPMMYYSHNIHFESFADTMQGRYADAQRAAKQLEEHLGPHVHEMPMLEGFLPVGAFNMARFGKWDEILKSPAPPNQQLFSTASWHYLRGAAFAAKGDPASAEKEMAALMQTQGNIDPNAKLMQNPQRYVLDIAVNDLAGRIALARKDFAKSIASFEKAADLQDHLVYIEPPEWYYPVRESLGAAHLAAGHAAEAETVYRQELEHSPRNARALVGLAEALRRQQKMEDASFVQRQADEAWKNADSPMPTLLQVVATK